MSYVARIKGDFFKGWAVVRWGGFNVGDTCRVDQSRGGVVKYHTRRVASWPHSHQRAATRRFARNIFYVRTGRLIIWLSNVRQLNVFALHFGNTCTQTLKCRHTVTQSNTYTNVGPKNLSDLIAVEIVNNHKQFVI